MTAGGSVRAPLLPCMSQSTAALHHGLLLRHTLPHSKRQ
jgi:hypothetical protein